MGRFQLWYDATTPTRETGFSFWYAATELEAGTFQMDYQADPQQGRFGLAYDAVPTSGGFGLQYDVEAHSGEFGLVYEAEAVISRMRLDYEGFPHETGFRMEYATDPTRRTIAFGYEERLRWAGVPLGDLGVPPYFLQAQPWRYWNLIGVEWPWPSENFLIEAGEVFAYLDVFLDGYEAEEQEIPEFSWAGTWYTFDFGMPAPAVTITPAAPIAPPSPLDILRGNI